MAMKLENCPVCGGHSIHEEFTHRATSDGGEWRVDRCGECGHGFVNPQPSWDELAPHYRSDYQAYETSHGARAEDEAVIAEARRIGELRHTPISPGIRLLDVGCGGGYFLRMLTTLGVNAEGVEPADAGYEQCRSQNLNVFHGTIYDYGATHEDAEFDRVTANHVVEHMPDPVSALHVMSGLLKPTGLMVISVPNSATPAAKSLRGRWHSSDLPRHLMQFTPQSLRRCGERAGLEVDRIITYTLPKSRNGSIRQWLRWRLGIPLRVTSRMKWAFEPIARRSASTLDRRGEGEALIAYFKRSSEASS